MTRLFAALTGIVIVVGLAMGVGLSMWQSGTVLGATQPSQTNQVANRTIGQTAALTERTTSRDSSTTSGVVESATGDSVTVRTASGTAKVALSASTAIRKSDVITSSEIKIGEEVLVMGSKDAEGVVAARSVQLGQNTAAAQMTQSTGGQSLAAGAPASTQRGSGSFGNLSQAAGTVDSAGPDKLVVKTATGNVTVTLSSQTILRRTVEGNRSDVVPGIGVTVVGQAAADGSIAATSIQIQAISDNQGGNFSRPGR